MYAAGCICVIGQHKLHVKYQQFGDGESTMYMCSAEQ
jgi:hypothetical protein